LVSCSLLLQAQETAAEQPPLPAAQPNKPGSWLWSQQLQQSPNEKEAAQLRAWSQTLAAQVTSLSELTASGNQLVAMYAQRDLPDLQQNLLAARLAAGQRVNRGRLNVLADGTVTLDGLQLVGNETQAPLLPPAPAGQLLPEGGLEIIGRDTPWRLVYDAEQPNPFAHIAPPVEDEFWNIVAAAPGLPLMIEHPNGQRLSYVKQ
jgi:hypothetical protein